MARRGRRSLRRATLLVTEANAATDNPMVFADDGDIVSGGNFHGAPVAIAADMLVHRARAARDDQRTASDRLVNPALSDLPAFLTADSGLQSGYMMAQVTAAALASEIKTLAHPASVDTIPTSANREDHVSMSMGAALKARTRARARDARHRGRDAVRLPGDRPARAADDVAAARSACTRASAASFRRSTVDRPPAPDIEAIARLIATDRWSPHRGEKSSKKFFNFKLTTRAYVLRLLPSAALRITRADSRTQSSRSAR